MNKRTLKACLIIAVGLFTNATSVYSQLGWNYEFSLTSQEYNSIAGVPGVVSVLDTMSFDYDWTPSSTPIYPSFGLLPFQFICEGSNVQITSLDVFNGRVSFSNNISVSGGFSHNQRKQGPYISAPLSSGAGVCANNANTYGVEVGSFAKSTRFNQSAGVSSVLQISGGQVCFANNFSSSSSGSTLITYMTGRLLIATLGTPPNRRFIIEFKNFHSIGTGNTSPASYQFISGSSSSYPADLMNFQIILFEGSNEIAVHFGNCIPGTGDNYSSYSNQGYVPGLINESLPCDLSTVAGENLNYTLLNQWCSPRGSYNPSNGDLLVWSPIDPTDDDNDGYTGTDGDCDESNPSVNPAATEICDAVDNNCNGIIDEGFDSDNDGFTSCSGDCDDTNELIYPGAEDVEDDVDNDCDGVIDENSDDDGDGVTPAEGDCDDTNINVGPNQVEVCNGLDDNCNEEIDEGFDLDNDGYASCAGDCDDLNAEINPGIIDEIDGIDNDCDDSIDEDGDADGDGVSPADGDCDDTNPAVGPSQLEFCNGIDDNCNGMVDENFDADGDGFATCAGDCDDLDGLIYPGAEEINDGEDNDCDDEVDETFDNDGDGVTPEEGDCDDSNITISPNAAELCNQQDDNCNGQIDEGLNCATNEASFFIATGFSPNGDGFNDTWQIPWLTQFSGYSITVVNRWEQIVFQTNNLDNGWDGTHKGQRLPMGDYFFVIKLDDGIVFSGALTLKY